MTHYQLSSRGRPVDMGSEGKYLIELAHLIPSRNINLYIDACRAMLFVHPGLNSRDSCPIITTTIPPQITKAIDLKTGIYANILKFEKFFFDNRCRNH